jgi:hypothetical protein
LDHPLSGKDLNYFSAKGKSAEEFVHQLATQTFFVDWCFPNPKRPDGKELCDLLVVFGSVAIIWQVKSLKLDAHGQPSQAEVEKNLRQTLGAKRYLLETKGTIKLENARRRPESFYFSTIQRVFLISALLCEPNAGPIIKRSDKGDYVHMMTGHSIELCLAELDTARDFIEYLEAKELLYGSEVSLMVSGGEEELLAFYLLHDRSLSRLQGEIGVLIDSGTWAGLHTRPEYTAAKKANEISYVCWDHLINETHNRTEESVEYEPIAREMASLRRFERRVASQAFMDALRCASEHDLHRLSFRRVFTLNTDDQHLRSDMTFCFLFYDVPEPQDGSSDYAEAREHRVGELEAMLYVARCRIDKPVVVGIATERLMNPRGSFDFALLQMPVVSPEWRASVENAARQDGMLVDLNWTSRDSDEYPNLEDQH